MRKSIWVSVFVMALVAVSVSGSQAASGVNFGLRTGMSVNPDQFVVGAQAILGRTLKVARFAPSVDAGFGDDLTTVLVNGDVRISLLTLPRAGTSLYGAVGPTLAMYDSDKGGSDTEIGLTLTAGLRLPMGSSNAYNLEARFGVGDVPDFRLLFGIMFGSAKKE